MKKSIELRANGKLLLTGEYLILAGARALAFPVRFGQSMKIGPAGNNHLHWISREKGVTWFSCEFDLHAIQINSSSNFQVSGRLREIVLKAKMINPAFLDGSLGLNISVEADYPLDWGMGSSSTLIALIAEWAHVDKFILFRMVSKGSGYDIACTDHDSMFFYQLKDGKISITDTYPGKALMNYVCFAYSGKKQQTDEELSAFLSGKTFTDADIERISELSSLICQADDALVLCRLVDEHEQILGRILKKEPVSKQFPDFPGSVKSLGAWGGDFLMFVSENGNEFIRTWLKQRGFSVVFSYNELNIPV